MSSFLQSQRIPQKDQEAGPPQSPALARPQVGAWSSCSVHLASAGTLWTDRKWETCIYGAVGTTGSRVSAGAAFGLSDCTGFKSDSKVHVHPEPVIVTLFRNGVFTDIMKLR